MNILPLNKPSSILKDWCSKMPNFSYCNRLWQVKMMTKAPNISKDTFVEILQDKDLVKPDDLLIFQTIYSLNKKEASATDLARLLGWKDKGAVVGRLVGLGKQIKKNMTFSK